MTHRIAAAGALIVMLVAVAALAGDVRIDGTYATTVPTGTPPLAVSSTTRVANLNADQVDGMDAQDLAVGSTVIDQAAAMAGGVTAGDAPGFPVTISEPGSYRLTSNLDITGEANPENLTVIAVTTDNVTLDLNGFALLGSTTCTGTPVTSCAPTGSGVGVNVNATGSRYSVTVRNGVITGMGSHGVACDRTCVVESLQLRSNGGDGVTVSNGEATLDRCVAFRNGGNGFWANGNVTDSTAQGNGADGIHAQKGVVRGNSASSNGDDGIHCVACTLLDNVASLNTTYGANLSYAAWGRNQLMDNGSAFADNFNVGPGGAVEVDVNVCGTGAAGVFACSSP